MRAKFQKRPPIIAGDRLGRLTAIQFVGNIRDSVAIWYFRCDCGRDVLTKLIDVRRGDTQSCGCLHRERTVTVGHRNATHGMTGSPEYNSWQHMIRRCTRPHTNGYKNYGGRGIKVCERWLHSFEAFLADMGHRPGPKHSLDRINNDGNYEPSNCRWATPHQQMRNRRLRRTVLYNGREMSLAEACDISGVSQRIAWKRLNRGWETERALTP